MSDLGAIRRNLIIPKEAKGGKMYHFAPDHKSNLLIKPGPLLAKIGAHTKKVDVIER